jgi:lipopolysaccharide/colanic/teichoic acid biosynthesis glycosyltransferase
LDELPQLWCVLKGEMSLVGPRPVPEMELERYGAQRGAYLQMRPGISGLWQVSGRNRLSYTERVALDVEYSRTVSIWIDLRIIGASLLEILRLNGR